MSSTVEIVPLAKIKPLIQDCQPRAEFRATAQMGDLVESVKQTGFISPSDYARDRRFWRGHDHLGRRRLAAREGGQAFSRCPLRSATATGLVSTLSRWRRT